jgi:hypothetical protein
MEDTPDIPLTKKPAHPDAEVKGKTTNRKKPKLPDPKEATSMEIEEFAVRTSGWSAMPIGSGDWDEGAARQALDTWAGDSIEKYGRAFLWSDGSGNKTGFKFPIARPADGKLTIIPRAVNNAKARLSQASIPAADKAKIETILNGIQRRMHESEMSLVASAAPVRPSKDLFAHPGPIPRRTMINYDEESGQLYGYLAMFGVCHDGMQNKCMLAPKSHTNYWEFHSGTVRTAEGDLLDVGLITMDTGHAPLNMSWAQAMSHYENTGTQAAIVRCWDDQFGIRFAGVPVPEADEQTIAKLRRSKISGDWRRRPKGLELVLALAVNKGGLQPQVFSEEGEVLALTAAGMVTDMDEAVETDVTILDGQVTTTGTTANTNVIVDWKAQVPTMAKAVAGEMAARDRRAKLLAELQDPDCGCGK